MPFEVKDTINEIKPYSKSEMIELIDQLSHQKMLTLYEKSQVIRKMNETSLAAASHELVAIYRNRYVIYLRQIDLHFQLTKKMTSEEAVDAAIQFCYASVAKQNRYSIVFTLMGLMTGIYGIVLGINSITPWIIEKTGLQPDQAIQDLGKTNAKTFLDLMPSYQLYKQLGLTALCRLNATAENALFSPTLLSGYEHQFKIDEYLHAQAREIDVNNDAIFSKICLNEPVSNLLLKAINCFATFLQSEIVQPQYTAFLAAMDFEIPLHRSVYHLFELSIDNVKYMTHRAEDRISIFAWFLTVVNEGLLTAEGCEGIRASSLIALNPKDPELKQLCEKGISGLNFFPREAVSETIDRAKQATLDFIARKKIELQSMSEEKEASCQDEMTKLKMYLSDLSRQHSELTAEVSRQSSEINSKASQLRSDIKRQCVPQFRIGFGTTFDMGRSSRGPALSNPQFNVLTTKSILQ